MRARFVQRDAPMCVVSDMELTFRAGRPTIALRTPTATFVERRYPGALSIGLHAHDYACVDLVLGGAVRERYRSFEREACAGELLFYQPDGRHSWSSGRAGARILHIILEREHATGRFDAPIEVTRLPRLAMELDREIRAGTPLALECLATEIVTEVEGWRLRERRRPAWLNDAVEMALRASPTLPELAAAAGVNPGHLVRTFRERVGCTPGELARRSRLREAARRLATGNDPLASVAIDSGFSDQSHLTRVFRSRFGVTPAAYRARYGVSGRG